MEALKLVAMDKDDIEVMSAHLQDGLVKVEDIRWRPTEHRFVIAVGRFDWCAAYGNKPEFRRRLTALRFDRVMNCKCRNVSPQEKDAVLNLLAVEYRETEGPAGVIELIFSGGGVVRLEVECLEAELADLGPVWTCTACPEHVLDPADVGVDAQARPGH